ncbi:MAG: arylamine N-acetyltransferase [Nannocystaceae bacterium]|nr:arylamine N-acetyltransferase [Nannocystaceae bacterium]
MDPQFAPDLDAYCDRIHYSGPRTPTLATLNAIIAAHVQTIPFENLDILLGLGVDLSPNVVECKLVVEGRGGYCFEQNSLLLHVLQSLGYSVQPLSARVRLGSERSFTPPRTHMLLRVDLDGARWLVDVGVGTLSPTCALNLDTDAVQTTPHEPRRLIREGAWSADDHREPTARLFHQVQLGGAWQDVCEMTLEPMPEIDRELSNWYTSTHPTSHFRDRLMVARATNDGRISLNNRTLTVRAADGTAHKEELASPEDLLSVLKEHFGLYFPPKTRFACSGLNWPGA